MRIVHAPVLTLEPQVATHAPEMFDVLCDPAIYEYENEAPASVVWLRERFAKLETRRSADGREQWLNWVVRLPSSALIGYVQATVYPDNRADIAYVLASAYWGRGLAHQAVTLMLGELQAHYAVSSFSAVFKRDNRRSHHLLERLGFTMSSAAMHPELDVAPDEFLMTLGDSAGAQAKKASAP